MVSAAGVVSAARYRGGGGKDESLIGGKLQERKKVRPLQSCPLPSVQLSSAQLRSAQLRSALLLTEIASEAGPTKNSLDFTRTFRTIVFPH